MKGESNRTRKVDQQKNSIGDDSARVGDMAPRRTRLWCSNNIHFIHAIGEVDDGIDLVEYSFLFTN